MKSKWSVGLSAFILLFVGGVPRGEQQPPPAQPPAAGAPAQPPAQAGRAGRGGIEAEIAAGADFSPRPPVTRLDPAAQQKLFLLPPGYKIEPVLTDPLIEDPVGVTFDGNGRMYVLEMRSYMQDADGSNSRAPISRISRHEDTNGDGTFDKHTVFVDKMVMPRIAFPLGDGVILALETDNRDMYKYTDTDGDGVADKKELFYPGVGRVTNMEWQPGGLTWAMDNWLYMTYNPFRLRLAPDGKILREETDSNGGQWWSAQDNHGKMWWVDGGGEIGPVNFQAPIVYGAFNVKDNFEPDFQVPWPAPGGIADMQGGMRRVRMPDGTLNHFTAASGVEIYRGHRLPEGHGRRSLLHRTGRPHRPAREDRRHRRLDAAEERLSAVRVPALDRSAVPAGRHHERARWLALPDGHVHGDHPGRAVRRAELVPAAQGRTAGARQAAQLGPHLAHHLRRDVAGSAAAADVPRHAGAARQASRARQRLVA